MSKKERKNITRHALFCISFSLKNIIIKFHMTDEQKRKKKYNNKPCSQAEKGENVREPSLAPARVISLQLQNRKYPCQKPGNFPVLGI